jgi:hypothetical protein
MLPRGLKKIFSLAVMVSFTGCASTAKNVSPAYVSPLQYQHYDCEQVGQELNRVGRKVNEVSGQQDRAANKDAVAMGVGLVVFWPALFFLIGGDKEDELARLKGEYEALEQCAVDKKCTQLVAALEDQRKIQEAAEKAKQEEEAIEESKRERNEMGI